MTIDLSPDRSILIVGPSWVGDMVMAQSLFKALKADAPDCNIDVLAPEWTRPLLQRMPEVRTALPLPISHGIFGWKMRRHIGQQLRHSGYQQAIVLPNSWKSALIPWFANIPVRTGWLGEMRYGLLNDNRKLNKHALPMMVQRFVSLAYPASQAQAAPSYQAPFMRATPVKPKFQALFDDSRKKLILCPGAEFGPAKQWPDSHYAALAEHYLQQDWQIIVLGSKADQAIAAAIEQRIKTPYRSHFCNLTGQTALEDAIDILATADQVVANDSGLMHIAAALQRPLIAVYGPTSPAFTPPLADNAQLLQLELDCIPCFKRTCPLGHHNCMNELSVNHVIETISTSQHD